MTHIYIGAERLTKFPGIEAHHEAKAQTTLTTVREALIANNLEHLLNTNEQSLEADYEEFWEAATRLAAAWKATNGDLKIISLADYNQLEFMKLMERNNLPRLGMVPAFEEGPYIRDPHLSDPVFLKYAGRFCKKAGLAVEAPHINVAEVMAERAAVGQTHVFIKDLRAKKGIYTLATSTNVDENDDLLMKAYWSYMHLEGKPETMLVQDLTPMSFETRFFIVDGKVVTYAGQVEEYTPLDFDSAKLPMREKRGEETSEVVDSAYTRDIAAKLKVFAEKVAHEHGGTLTIDIAINDNTGEPLVVEFNDIANAGLFACDVDKLFAALATARNTGYAYTDEARAKNYKITASLNAKLRK